MWELESKHMKHEDDVKAELKGLNVQNKYLKDKVTRLNSELREAKNANSDASS